jgi:hypothetical protein
VNLAHIPPRLIDEDMVMSMNLLWARSDGKYDLMIKNHVFSGISLPNPRRTDVRKKT